MHGRERERTNIVSECLSSGCKNLESNSLLVVFRRIKRNIRTRTFLNLVPIFTLKCTSALSCFLREKEREICVSFEQQRKERSGRKAIFQKGEKNAKKQSEKKKKKKKRALKNENSRNNTNNN